MISHYLSRATGLGGIGVLRVVYSSIDMKKFGITILILMVFAAQAHSIDLSAAEIVEFLTDYATFVEAANTGTTSFPILKIPSGGEYEGMGTAYTAVGRDPSFVDSNPASTSILEFTEFSVTHNNLIADVSMEGLVYSMRFGDLGVGLAGKFVHVPFTAYDSFGVQQSSTLYSETVAGVNLSYNFLDSFYFHGLAVGMNLKVAARRISELAAPDQSGAGVMADLGVLTRFNFLKHYPSRDRNLSFGILAQNVGPPSRGEPLPTSLRAGVAYAPIRRLTISGDVIYPISLASGVEPEPFGFATGLSLQVADFVSTQAGFQMQGGNPRFTLGSIVDLSDVTLVVNWILDRATQVDRPDRFSLQARFNLGDRGRADSRATVEEYYPDALVAFAAGDTEETVELTQKALELDPRFQPARETLATALRSLELERQMNSIRLGEQIPELEIEQAPDALAPTESLDMDPPESVPEETAPGNDGTGAESSERETGDSE